MSPDVSVRVLSVQTTVTEPTPLPRQATDQRVARRHSPQANRQRDRDHGRQSFRDCRDRQRDPRFHHPGDWRPCNSEARDAGADDDQGIQTRRRPRTSSRRSSGVRSSGSPATSARFVRSSVRRRWPRPPPEPCRPGDRAPVGHVRRSARGRSAAHEHHRFLRDRHRLPGQHGFVHAGVRGGSRASRPRAPSCRARARRDRRGRGLRPDLARRAVRPPRTTRASWRASASIARRARRSMATRAPR